MSCLQYFGFVSACFIIVLFAGNAQSEIFWTEDWEGTGTEVGSRWSETSCANGTAWPDNNPVATNSSPARTTAVAYSGTHSLQYHFTGTQYETPPHGGCAASRHFPASDEIWMRWYERWGTGMQPIPGTKRHYMYNESGYYGHYFLYYGNSQLLFVAQGVYDAPEGRWGTQNLYQNAASFNMPENQWVCYEAHLKYNTPGQADGVYEAFATNMTTGGPTIQFANYTGRQWRGTSTSDRTPSTAKWGTWKVYTQDGMGDIYDDLYAVGTTRCGCGTVSPKYLEITTASLPNAVSGRAYSATLGVAGGKAPYGWTISSGSLLPGLSLSKTAGTITGTPTTAGRCNFTVKVMDASVPSLEGTKAFTIIASTGTGIVRSEWLSRNQRLGFRIAAGSLKFAVPQKGRYAVSIHDLSGREVWAGKGECQDQIAEVALNRNLNEGIYILRIVSGTGIVSGRVCVLK